MTGTRTSGKLAITAAGEGDAYWFFDNIVVVRSPEGMLPVVIEIDLPEGSSAPLHYHERLADSWYVVSGKVAIREGEEVGIVKAGDYLTTRPGVHNTHYVLEGPAKVILVHANTDFLEFVKRFGSRATDRSAPPSEPLDFARSALVAAETGQPVVGPPMTAEEAASIASRS